MLDEREDRRYNSVRRRFFEGSKEQKHFLVPIEILEEVKENALKIWEKRKKKIKKKKDEI